VLTETVRIFFVVVSVSVILFELWLYCLHFYLFAMYILRVGELCPWIKLEVLSNHFRNILGIEVKFCELLYC